MSNKTMNNESPHYMKADADCMGHPTPGYWRQFVTCCDGTTAIGIGKTSKEAEDDAAKQKMERENYVNLDPREIIKDLVTRSNGCRGTNEQQDFNLAVAKILGIV